MWKPRPARASLVVVTCWTVLAAATPARATTYMAFAHVGDDEDVRLLATGAADTVLSGDINGDGIADLLLGAPSDSCCGPGSSDGVVRCFLGRASWPAEWDVATLAPDVTFGHDTDGDRLKLCDVTDINGDGVLDVVLVASGADGPAEARRNCGEAYVYFGRASWPALVRPSVTPPNVLIHGAATFQLHDARAADADGDRAADLLVFGYASGGTEARLHLGAAGRATIDEAVDAADARIVKASHAACSFADVSGDARADLVLASATSSAPTLLLLGSSTWPAVRDAQTEHDAAFAVTGTSHVALADAVGDATLDVILSDWPNLGPSRGCVRVFSGGPSITTAGPASTITGRSPMTLLWGMGAADLDGNGGADLLLWDATRGARGRDPWTDEVVVVRSPLPASRNLELAPADLVIYSDSAQRRGMAAADFNADGVPDLAVTNHRGEGVGLLLSPASFAPTPPPARRHVDASLGDDANDGLTWPTAKATVEAALADLDRVPGPVSVLVAEGTYAGNLVLGAATQLVGGHPTGGAAPRHPRRHPTVLDGLGQGTVVTIESGVGTESSGLDGFTVTGGFAIRGAGISIPSGSPFIANNVLTGNTAYGTEHGWRASCTDHTGWPATWVLCDRPCSGLGAGIDADYDTAPVILNNLVVDNSLLLESSGEECMDPLPFGWTCDFPPIHCKPSAYMRGEGIRLNSIEATVRSNTVTRNEGDGIRVGADASIVEDNVAFDNGFTDLAMAQDAIVRHNFYETSTRTLGSTNRRLDPKFVDPAAGDYRLSQIAAGQPFQSPAVDAGSVSAASRCLGPLPCLSDFSTRTDGVLDTGMLDVGFHEYLEPINQAPTFGGLQIVSRSADCALTLTWNAATDREGDDPVTYEIFRATVSRAQDFGAPPHAVVTTVSFEDAPVSQGTRYYYVVRARDALGASEANTTERSVIPVDTEPPALDAGAAVVSACGVSVAFATSDACPASVTVELHRSEVAGFTPSGATVVASGAASPLLDAVSSNGLFFYRLVAVDGAGFRTTSEQQLVRADACDAALVPPGEAFIPVVRKDVGGARVEVTPAPGAAFHRLYRGTLAALPAYDHSASPGPNGIPGDVDDVGVCHFTTPSVVDPVGLILPGNLYWFAVGVSADALEGPHGFDSFGRAGADATTGFRGCP